LAEKSGYKMTGNADLAEFEAKAKLNKDVSRVLVAIASYGTANDLYLREVIAEYQKMSVQTDIVILSNIRKQVPANVALRVVDLKGRNPWSLPFVHKQLFAEQLNEYDIFVYSEDDMLLTERNLRAFLDLSATLPDNEIPGFLRYEKGTGSERNFPELHGRFRWDPQSLCRRGEHTFAFFTAEHAACYALTRRQLAKAIDSGGFLVGPHEGRYDLLCTVATDPYTQCGMRKLICLSRIDDVLIHHLPNKYVGTRFGVGRDEFQRQLNSLLVNAADGSERPPLFEPESRLLDRAFSTDYYEPARPDILVAVPPETRTALSIGCGWGATEGALAQQGIRVTAVPIDGIIAGAVKARGIEVVEADLDGVVRTLDGRQFDFLLLQNVLHRVEDPRYWLSKLSGLLHSESTVAVVVPNVPRLHGMLNFLRGKASLQLIGGFGATGVHLTSFGIVARWLRVSGLVVAESTYLLSERARRVSRATFGFADRFVADELVIVAKKP
jgi:2-polyprenyl-3-methyl-5-hydroxy-6-metoxy-1,4-benzoquinol methylase